MTEAEEVLEALHDVIDPELGVDIVDLGLVYGVGVRDGIAKIAMTLTSAACPLTDMIEDQIQMVLEGIVNGIELEWVWSPPWDVSRVNDDGRAQLQALGFRI